MRMKMFAAKTLQDAKALIFAEMGKDAVILSEREVEGGVEVRAATDKMGGGMVPAEPLFMKRFEDPGQLRIVDTSLRSRVRDALSWHGAPSGFARRVSEEGVLDPGLTDPVAALEEGLSASSPVIRSASAPTATSFWWACPALDARPWLPS